MALRKPLRDRIDRVPPDWIAAPATALVLTACAAAAALAAGEGVRVARDALPLPETLAAYVVFSRAAQFAFLVVALGYVAYRGTPERYVRFGRPSWRDLGWLVAFFPLLVLASGITTSVLGALGIPLVSSAGSTGPSLAEHPGVLPLVFVVYFLFAAPAEELLFRGVVQGRLREAFSAAPAIVLAAVCFALLHVPFYLQSGETAALTNLLAQTFYGGLLFGLLYERTDTLVVPAAAHATMWSWNVLAHYATALAAAV
ncbi:CPBP family intramembrane glutamic endopeptidase [Halomicrobium salinisoli]|uniref:CPBP family intramembrane glutamic endopeptidase n=1 Tax=Halomicrobium salinisoli TaxID=2878391 RepID=UPI001CF0613B|nr:CPBP family intramembrane glutamic endopeptidase [Halomicrobium salinisoli]